MRKTHPTIAALAAVTIAFAACEQRPADETGEAEEEVATTSADAEAELEELRTSYEEAWNARDWDSVVLMYTDDFQGVTSEGETMARSDVETTMRDTAQAPPEDARLAIETETMEIAESGDLAYGTGTTTLSATGPDGQPMTVREHWMAGFEKVDGQWRIDRLVSAPAESGAPATGEPAPMDAPAGGAVEEADTTAM